MAHEVDGGVTNPGDRNDGASAIVMRVKGISKSFPGVRALNNVDLELRAGEVHALCGENGAGKSTLMKILSGDQRPDSGEIHHKGEPIELLDPLDGKRRGILLIHQEVSLVPQLTAAENVFLGNLPRTRYGRFDRGALMRKAAGLFAECGVDIDPTVLVGDLPIAKQQMVEVARAFAFPYSVVIFDEPTASLTENEAEALFTNIERLRQRGATVVYISHKLNEVFRIADRVTVLRDGEVRGTTETASTSEEAITRLMIGRSLERYFNHSRRQAGAELLRVEKLSVPGFVDEASFAIRRGEILGLYGLVGAGRSELAEVIFGLRPKSGGQIFWEGAPTAISFARDAVALGIGFVPEDRKKMGLVPTMGSQENLSLAVLRQVSLNAFLSRRREAGLYKSYADQLGIRSASPTVRVSTLSGGNQQKVVLAKWLATKPKLLILDEPTRGIDVGAKSEVHALIARLAEQGIAILLISSEMPEIMNLSHRILTIAAGTITGELDAATATEAMIIEKVMHHGTAESSTTSTARA